MSRTTPSTAAVAGKILAVFLLLLPLAQAATSTTGLPGNKTQEQYNTEGRYNYVPSLAAAVIFLVLWIIIGGTQLFQYFYYRAWFWWVMLLAITRKSRSLSISAALLIARQWNSSASPSA